MNKKYSAVLKEPDFTQICALLLNTIKVKDIGNSNKAAVYPAV